jgi:hypothetical protein
MNSFRNRYLTALAVLLSATPVAAVAQAESGMFMLRLGQDTVAIERWSRRGNQVEATVVRRTPSFGMSRYSLTLNPDGSVATFEQQLLKPDGSPTSPTPAKMVFTGDSVVRTIVQNNNTVVLRSPAPRGTLPGAAFSPLLLAMQATTARRVGAAYVIGFAAQQQAPVKIDVRLFGADSAELVAQGLRTGLKLDARGQLRRYDGTLTTGKYIGLPVPEADLIPLATAWAAREQAGEGLGIAARDTARAALNNATVWIDYGRPSKRGRDIWGALVPFDTAWRMGANAATQLKTDRELVLGGVTVPAGMYSLFLLPTKGGATLLVNSQTGQWGTAWDPAKDVYRIPLVRRDEFPTVEERFTIRFIANRLELHWDRSGYFASVETK